MARKRIRDVRAGRAARSDRCAGRRYRIFAALHDRDFELFAEVHSVIKPIGEFSAEELAQDGVKFNSIHSISRAAARLSLTREIVGVFTAYIGRARVRTAIPTFYRGSQQPPHIDFPYVRCQTRLAHLAASRIPLEDIQPEVGILPLIIRARTAPGRHRLLRLG